MASITSLHELEDDKDCQMKCSREINPKYIPLKLIYFLFMAGQGANVVFRSLFIKFLGMSTTQNGIIWAVDRVFGIFVPPILGWISDKSGKPKATIVWLLITGSLICGSLYFIPPDSALHDSSCVDSYCALDNTSSEITCSLTAQNNSCMNLTNLLELHFNCNRGDDNIVNFLDDAANNSFTPVIKDTRMLSYSQKFEYENVTVECYLNPQPLNDTSGSRKSFVPLPRTWKDVQTTAFRSCSCFQIVYEMEVFKTRESYGVTFWMLLILMVLSSFAVFGGNTLIDSVILSSFSEKDKHHFSLQRLWGGLGFGAMSLLVGFGKDEIASKVTDPQSNLPFLPFFLSPGFCWGILCFIVCFFLPQVSEEHRNNSIRFSAMKVLISNVRVAAFLTFAVTVGYAVAVGEVYMFWLAEQRFNASSTILAASIAISTCFEIFAYTLCGFLVRRFGPRIIMSIGLFTLGIRVYLYTLVSAAWHLLFAEILRGIGWPLCWIAICHHTSRISPRGLAATTMGLIQAGTFGIGYGSGAFLGGFLFEKFGGDTMFKISFVLIISVSILYMFFYKSYDRLMAKRRRNEVSEEEMETFSPKDINHNI